MILPSSAESRASESEIESSQRRWDDRHWASRTGEGNSGTEGKSGRLIADEAVAQDATQNSITAHD